VTGTTFFVDGGLLWNIRADEIRSFQHFRETLWQSVEETRKASIIYQGRPVGTVAA